MGDIKPIIAVAALMGAIVTEGWLRSKVHQFDEDYVGVLDLIEGAATRIPESERASNVRPSPRPSARSYRASSSWSPGSNVPSPQVPGVESALL
jgi:hypothetical protein